MSNNKVNTDNTDNSTISDNTVDPAVVAQIVTDALNGDFASYIAANVSYKANVRKALNDALHSSVDNLDMEGATRAKAAIEGCKGSKAAKVATPVNHTETVLNRANALITAGIALLRGEAVPTGINPEDVDFSDNQAVQDFLDNTDWSVIPGNADEKDITAIATHKVTKSTERVDIAAHIAKVIEGAESGTFFSVRRIASTSTEFAPNGCPSDGAVAMRLFPQKGETTLKGVKPVNPRNGDDVPVIGLIVL